MDPSSKGRPQTPQYDPTITDKVIAATGPNAHPRLAQVMPSLVRHLHDFAREVNLTVAEWTAAVDMINECGKMSDDRRNETQLLCDIIGLESLVDEITSKMLATSMSETPSAILGPFYRQDAPLLSNGDSIVNLSPSVSWYEQAIADSAFLTGRVVSGRSGMPIKGAVVDVWHTAPNGLYEQQDESQPDMNMRGRFATDADGRYSLYALRPVAYPIPDDGPAGRLLAMLDRHPYRPGHIHFIVSASGFRTLTTQVFDDRDEYITNDSVFAVKDELVVKFKPRDGDSKALWTLEYDFVLGSQEI
ncbi:Intradiol ring-cleavage dioxygenase [Lasiosphaeria miniovina]|uniref:Intradiol ring-cleavage dioxygenase n=1 Tax=Lasiosphaeria miniovina TaxID=1954250 RepID=A0AA40A4I9_9PEZI|nr:Intradiol ring-cleavage dioxygenase [Lasiosphaeria miniovina]KAK0709142.1 Intradiol ring-cleavage dioxygenase [Lasiosphaeria miniovina]